MKKLQKTFCNRFHVSRKTGPIARIVFFFKVSNLGYAKPFEHLNLEANWVNIIFQTIASFEVVYLSKVSNILICLNPWSGSNFVFKQLRISAFVQLTIHNVKVHKRSSNKNQNLVREGTNIYFFSAGYWLRDHFALLFSFSHNFDVSPLM